MKNQINKLAGAIEAKGVEVYRYTNGDVAVNSYSAPGIEGSYIRIETYRPLSIEDQQKVRDAFKENNIEVLNFWDADHDDDRKYMPMFAFKI